MLQQLERELSFPAWMSQLIAAYCGPVLGVILLDALVLKWRQDTITSQALDYIFVAAESIALASVIAKILPGSKKEGVLIWILPTLFEAAAVVWQVWRTLDVSSIAGVFYIRRGQGEASWIVFLLTLPTWACLAYSSTMWWWRNKS